MKDEEKDEELEKIKKSKLQEMMRKIFIQGTEKQGKPVLDTIVEVNDATFKQTVQNHSLVVVDCWAPWCAPCNMVAPILVEMARDYAGRILFGKLNVDKNRRVAAQYQIMSIPTLLIFKDGKIIDRIIGAMPRKIMESKITRHL